MSEFWAAWHVWCTGQQIDNFILWGHKILWWGRLGKIAQFVGAVTVIIDLIGPERIRAWGHNLRHRASDSLSKKMRAALVIPPKVLLSVVNFFLTSSLLASRARLGLPLSETQLEELDKRQKEFSDKLDAAGVARWTVDLTILLMAFSLLAFWATFAPSIVEWSWYTPILTIVATPILFLFFPLIFILSNAILWVIAITLEVTLIRPISTVLEYKMLSLTIKWFSFTLLVLGFIFDLLAS